MPLHLLAHTGFVSVLAVRQDAQVIAIIRTTPGSNPLLGTSPAYLRARKSALSYAQIQVRVPPGAAVLAY